MLDGRMFEELEEADHVDVSADSPDRTVLYAIWAKSSDLTAEEAWAILFERYPDDPRFLLLNAYGELAEGSVSGAWTPDYFLKKLERILAGANGSLDVQAKDLLAFAGAILAAAKGEDAKRLADVRAKLGAPAASAKRDERAGLKLRRFEREVLRELHDRTVDNAPLGVRASAPAASSTGESAWESAVADKKKPRKRYAPTTHLEKGELVEHPKFGVGLVTQIEPGRATILFESGTRKLVCT
jgi:hypothetical protein